METVVGRARALWRRLIDGFWFVPGAVASVYILLAVVLTAVDHAFDTRQLPITFSGDENAARSILSTIAASLITVAGLAFSLTIVVLTLVAAQFTTRTIRSFLADRLNQVVAGAFVGTFAYCLLIMRSVGGRQGEGASFVPALSVTVAVLLSLVALAFLLVFINHTAQSVQASHITVRIAQGTFKAIDDVYPQRRAEASADRGEDLPRRWYREADPARVSAGRPGYVQTISLKEMLEYFEDDHVRIHLAVRPGEFVTERTPLAAVWPADALSEEAARAMRRWVVVGHERDMRQDSAYGMRLLADIALKGLSPAINDPTTSVACIGYLRAALERLAERETLQVRRHEHESVTVITERWTFEEHLETAFGEITRYGAANARVATATMRALLHVADAARAAEAYERLADVGEMARRAAEAALEEMQVPHDRRAIEEALEGVEAEIRAAPDLEVGRGIGASRA